MFLRDDPLMQRSAHSFRSENRSYLTNTSISFYKKAWPLCWHINLICNIYRYTLPFGHFLDRQDVETNNAQRFCLELEMHTIRGRNNQATWFQWFLQLNNLTRKPVKTFDLEPPTPDETFWIRTRNNQSQIWRILWGN